MNQIFELLADIARLEDLKVWADNQILRKRTAIAEIDDLRARAAEGQDVVELLRSDANSNAISFVKHAASRRKMRVSNEELQAALDKHNGHVVMAANETGMSSVGIYQRLRNGDVTRTKVRGASLTSPDC